MLIPMSPDHPEVADIDRVGQFAETAVEIAIASRAKQRWDREEMSSSAPTETSRVPRQQRQIGRRSRQGERDHERDNPRAWIARATAAADRSKLTFPQSALYGFRLQAPVWICRELCGAD
jgi:hypothetical protein